MEPQEPARFAAVDFDCIFCAIADGRAPAAIVYETAQALVFMDIHPIAQGHLLIVPKEHCRNLFDIDDGNAQAVMHAARVAARALRSAFNADGANLFLSSERAAGQAVFHFHFHLIPRFRDDGLMSREANDRRMDWRSRGNPTAEELAATAERIRAHIEPGPADGFSAGRRSNGC